MATYQSHYSFENYVDPEIARIRGYRSLSAATDMDNKIYKLKAAEAQASCQTVQDGAAMQRLALEDAKRESEFKQTREGQKLEYVSKIVAAANGSVAVTTEADKILLDLLDKLMKKTDSIKESVLEELQESEGEGH